MKMKFCTNLIFSKNKCIVLPCLLLLTLLSACTPTQQITKEDAEPSAEQALIAEKNQNFSLAAKLWTQSSNPDPAIIFQYRLYAIDNWLKANNIKKARNLANDLGSYYMDQEQRILLDLRQAEIAFALKNYFKAQALLIVPTVEIPSKVAQRYIDLRAQTNYQSHYFLEAAKDWIYLTNNYAETINYLAKNQQIFEALFALSTQKIEQLLAQNTQDSYLNEWLQFAYSIKQTLLANQSMELTFDRFQQQYPEHPANQLTTLLIDELGSYFIQPKQIGVLLPLSGKYTEAAKIIRDGIIASYYNQSQTTSLKIYNTDHFLSIQDAYQQAINDDADFIIGPLDKDNVNELFNMETLATPVIALNQYDEPYSKSQPYNSRFQLTLSPEQDAKQSAKFARKMGFANALILTPENTWGERIANAFRNTFVNLGGDIVQTSTYSTSNTNYNNVIKSLLNIHLSNQRHQKINSIIRHKTAFEPVKRNDIDMIFIGALPKYGRLIKPMIEFNHASDIPIIATSHIYQGIPDQKLDQDLNGIFFCDAPWILEQATDKNLDSTAIFTAATSQNNRFFALGMDALQIIPHSKWLSQHPTDIYPGYSGNLTISSTGNIERNLNCAQFSNGLPRKIKRQDLVINQNI